MGVIGIRVEIKFNETDVNSICLECKLSQYLIKHLIVRSRKALKPRDLHLEFSDHSEFWLAHWQHYCGCACKISKWNNNLIYQTHGFESSWGLKIIHLIGYWNTAQGLPCCLGEEPLELHLAKYQADVYTYWEVTSHGLFNWWQVCLLW